MNRRIDGLDCNLAGLVYVIQPTPDVIISYVDPQSIRSSITWQRPRLFNISHEAAKGPVLPAGWLCLRGRLLAWASEFTVSPLVLHKHNTITCQHLFRRHRRSLPSPHTDMERSRYLRLLPESGSSSNTHRKCFFSWPPRNHLLKHTAFSQYDSTGTCMKKMCDADAQLGGQIRLMISIV